MTPARRSWFRRLRDRVGIGAHVGRQRHDRVAGALADALDVRRVIAFENRAVLGEGDNPCGILHRLPVGIFRATFHVIDRLAVQHERDTQFDQGLHDALAGLNTLARSSDRLLMTGADGGKPAACRPIHIDNAPPGEITLQGPRRFFLDLAPGIG